LGLVSWLVTGSLKETPLQSEALDALAEVMHVNRILKKGKSKRYFKARFLLAGGLSSFNRVFFDSKYLQMLLPDELLAVGAHEFTHINERHGEKRFLRIFGPSLIIGALAGIIGFFDFGLIESVSLFFNSGKVLTCFFVAAVFFWITMISSSYFIAKWNCQQEIKCDLSAVKFANGEAMITALEKLKQRFPKKSNVFLTRLSPKYYPTLEQRTKIIRAAMEDKKNYIKNLEKV
jgi:Zn-dependent protease with chaperone function